MSSSNEVESFEVSRESGSLCTSANNQREAYNSTVLVLDREENGEEGSLILNFSLIDSEMNVTSLEQYTELTGCRDGERERERERGRGGEERERWVRRRREIQIDKELVVYCSHVHGIFFLR